MFPLFSQEMSYTQFSLNACKLGVCVFFSELEAAFGVIPLLLPLLSFASHVKCHMPCFCCQIYLNGYISRLNHDNIVTCSRDGSAIIWIPRSRRSHVSLSNSFLLQMLSTFFPKVISTYFILQIAKH